MMAKRQLLTLGAGMAAASAGIWLANRHQVPSASPESSGLDALWQLKLPTPSGQTLRLSSFKDKPLLVNFWATWCPPCVEEMPLLEQFYQQHSKKGIQLLAIAADKAEAVTLFLAKHSISFPIVLAGFDGISISKALGNETGGLPHTLLIAAKGGILFAKKGQLTTDDINQIASLMV